jgi:putative two-component system response regulator
MYQPHVLVVENHPKLLRSISFLLAIAGYEVSSVTDGNEAVSHLRGCTPDLIISGINLPGLNGFELTRLTRALVGPTPVVLLNPTDDYELFVEALDAGAADVLAGPFSGADLIEMVSETLANQPVPEMVPVEMHRLAS